MYIRRQVRALQFSIGMALTTAALFLVVSVGAFAETASSPVSGGLAAGGIVDNVLYPGALLQDEGPHGLIFVDTFDDELYDGGGDCSLREAIQAANLNRAVDGCPAGGVYDIIHLPAGTYELSLSGRDEDANATGDLDVLTDILSLVGAGAQDTVINGQNIDRVLHVHAGASVEVQGVTFTGGLAKRSGGGIYNAGVLALIQSTVRNNRTSSEHNLFSPGSPGWGGGIYNAGRLRMIDSQVADNGTGSGAGIIYGSSGGSGGGLCNAGSATVINSSFSGNTTGSGGCGNHWPGDGGSGGGMYNGGTLTLTHSSLANNGTGGGPTCAIYDGGIATGRGGSGGGIYNVGGLSLSGSTIMDNATGGGSPPGPGAGIANGSTLVVVDSTISGNRTGYRGGGISNSGRLTVRNTTIAQNVAADTGGGLYAGGIVELVNSLLAENRAGDEPGDCACSGPDAVRSLGYNLAEVAGACPLTATGDITGTAACLEPLRLRGGWTSTHGLLPDSPAIDAGSCPGSTTDQRGFRRPVDIPDALNVADACDIGAFERGAYRYFYLPLIFRTSP